MCILLSMANKPRHPNDVIMPHGYRVKVLLRLDAMDSAIAFAEALPSGSHGFTNDLHLQMISCSSWSGARRA